MASSLSRRLMERQTCDGRRLPATLAPRYLVSLKRGGRAMRRDLATVLTVLGVPLAASRDNVQIAFVFAD